MLQKYSDVGTGSEWRLDFRVVWDKSSLFPYFLVGVKLTD